MKKQQAGSGWSGVGTRWLIAAVMMVTVAAGCQTVNDDLTGLFEELSRPSPSKAARWMFDPNPDKRRRGTTLIAGSPYGGAEAYVRAYADMTQNDSDPLVRATAIRALARHGSPEHAIVIAEQLTHASPQVRWEAAKGLQRLHNPAIIDVMIKVLQNEDEDADVRMAIADALGQYHEDRVFQALLVALDHSELAVNTHALNSLRTLTGEDFGMNRGAWFRWREAVDQPFARGGTYTYDTYQRDPTLVEYIAFWTQPQWESPAPPAGLLPEDAERTYEDSGEAGEPAEVDS